jgi:predicted dienelactone hydrolase
MAASVIVPGPFPLIVFSLGTGASNLAHHDSMAALARAGFEAASVEHARDNYRDDSAFGTDVQLIGRPHHIVALIDAILAHPAFGPLIDRAQIGMASHSAGGATALLIAGAPWWKPIARPSPTIRCNNVPMRRCPFAAGRTFSISPIRGSARSSS